MHKRICVLASFVIAASFASASHAASTDAAQLQVLEQKLATAVEARNLDAIMQAYIPNESLFVSFRRASMSEPRHSARTGKTSLPAPRAAQV